MSAASAYWGENANSGARESRSSWAMSAAGSIVEIGTGIAPIRIAAR
jgi:hypothetical protein